jgi:hypothetical protein
VIVNHFFFFFSNRDFHYHVIQVVWQSTKYITLMFSYNFFPKLKTNMIFENFWLVLRMVKILMVTILQIWIPQTTEFVARIDIETIRIWQEKLCLDN